MYKSIPVRFDILTPRIDKELSETVRTQLHRPFFQKASKSYKCFGDVSKLLGTLGTLNQVLGIKNPSRIYRKNVMCVLSYCFINTEISLYVLITNINNFFNFVLVRVTKDGQYQCVTCNKKYKTRSAVGKHIKYECNKPPQFMCPVCGRGFKQKSNLKGHMYSIHRQQMMENFWKNIKWFTNFE